MRHLTALSRTVLVGGTACFLIYCAVQLINVLQSLRLTSY